MNTKTRFKVNLETGVIEGPADYMAERFDADEIMESIKTLSMAAPSHITTEQLVRVALQTDYAAYVGQKQLRNWK